MIIKTGLPPTTTSSNCDIRWRDVWREAVGAGLLNAIRGGIIGGTAGTFVVPLLGTATGAVNGAIFGFAAGFITGTAGAVTYQVFWNCLLNSPTTSPNLNCADPTFSVNNFDYCNIDKNSQDLRWYLLN